MKKNVFKTILFSILLGLCSFFGNAYELFKVNDVANNCVHTGNPSDYCYASDGTHNIRILECKPGTRGVCNFDPPPPAP